MSTLKTFLTIFIFCCLSVTAFAQADTSSTATPAAASQDNSSVTAAHPASTTNTGTATASGAIDLKSDPNCVCKVGETTGFLVQPGTVADVNAPKVPCRCVLTGANTPASAAAKEGFKPTAVSPPAGH